MVCYASLCVFSRFALILMLASATSMWERRLDLKSICIFTDRSMAVLLLWIFFVTYVSCLSCYLVAYLLQSFDTCLERADLLALLYVVIYCVLSLPDGVSWVKSGT